MKRVFYWIYHELQNHYWTLLFISKLQKMQITTMIGDVVCYPSIRKNMKSPNKATMDARNFYEKNKNDVKSVLSMLADQKSKDVYKNVIAYRMGKSFIKKESLFLMGPVFLQGYHTLAGWGSLH